MNIEHYVDPKYSVNGGQHFMIGRSKKMKELFSYLNGLANQPSNVLLLGQSGTGKELSARALHYNGKRNKHNFVAVNCAGIPSELLESELFGHVKGAFTGSVGAREGKFVYAKNGTILLDEIGEMSLDMQSKILRVLQEKEVTPVGSEKSTPVNFRLVASTNKNLEDEVKKGTFREDLFYRLNVVPLSLPSLSDRKEDIMLIIDGFQRQFNTQYKFRLGSFTDDAVETLQDYNWPGNVRELQNVVERIFVIKALYGNDGHVTSDDIVFGSNLLGKRRTDSSLFQKNVDISSDTTKYDNKNTLPGNEFSDSVDITSKFSDDSFTGHHWYDSGVLPVPLNTLKKYTGVKALNTILSRIKNGELASSDIGAGTRSIHIIYLTHDTIDKVFSDTSSSDYVALKEKISSNDFNETVKKPFILTSQRNIMLNDNLITSVPKILNTVVHKLDDAHYDLYTPHMNEYVALLSGKGDKSVVQKELLTFYEKFQSLK